MKIKFTHLIPLLAAITLMYSACKKGDSTSTTVINTSDLSKQIAVSLYKSLAGQYGGANINDGIKAPSSLTPSLKGPRINSTTSPYCGYTIDTAYYTTQTSGDTVKGYRGHFKFTYACTASTLDSYILADSITNTEAGSSFSNTFKLTQNYFVKATDNTYKKTSVEGNITNSFHNLLLDGTHTISQYHNMDSQYALSGVIVDVSSGIADIISGTSSFASQITNLDPTTPLTGYFGNLTGTITFLGNHLARVSVTLNGQTSINTVNMLTGTVTAG